MTPPPDAPLPERSIEPWRRLVRALPYAVAALVVLGAAVAAAKPLLQESALGRTVVATLHLDAESGVGTWFSSSLLLGSALLLGYLGSTRRQAGLADARPWTLLALACAFLSLDESVGLHERLGNAFARTLPVGTMGTFAWIIPGSIAVAALALAFRRFLLRLPDALRRGLLRSGLVYFGGAIGCEAVGSLLFVRYGRDSLAFEAEVVVEEGLEMFGALLLLETVAWVVLGKGQREGDGAQPALGARLVAGQERATPVG